MTNKPILLADVAELGNVLRAMDEWEATGGDVTSAHGRRSFVDSLDDDAADELSGLALTRLMRHVLEEKHRIANEKIPADETRALSGNAYQTTPATRSVPQQGRRPVAV